MLPFPAPQIQHNRQEQSSSERLRSAESLLSMLIFKQALQPSLGDGPGDQKNEK